MDDECTGERPPRSVDGTHPDNRWLLLRLANFLVEAREHSTRLRMHYRNLRDLPHAAAGHFGELLLEEQKRHLARIGEQLEELRENVRNG